MGLEIIAQKAKYLLINAEPSYIKLGTDEITAFTKYTYLKVDFDTTRKNYVQIKKQRTQAQKITGYLTICDGVKKLERSDSSTSMYKALVKSHLIYGSRSGD